MALRRMSMPELFKTTEWQRLSARQKLWLQTYLESGNDRQLATNCSYEASGENARTFSYQIVRQKKIQAALNRYFNKSARDIFLDQLRAEIKASKPGSAARERLIALSAQMTFGAKIPKQLKKGSRKKIKENKS
jgi:hypothetical protein